MNKTTVVKKEVELVRDLGVDGVWYSIYIHDNGKRRYVSGASTEGKANEVFETVKQAIRDGKDQPVTLRREVV